MDPQPPLLPIPLPPLKGPTRVHTPLLPRAPKGRPTPFHWCLRSPLPRQKKRNNIEMMNHFIFYTFILSYFLLPAPPILQTILIAVARLKGF